ncbi:CAMK protein Kinase [Phytophthora palmivora]|uniref:CAMK protein Kinase n=1 Tax=Phytophthora palmivora TaxID=4796 RepID=A0A2P4XLD3_9STRA|nr:CAMK protein Kinase [Phytophthora palmivora]
MPVVSVGFIGSGRLAERVARDLIKNVTPQRKFSYRKQRLVSTLLASDPSEERRRVFHRLGFTTTEANQDVLADCDLVFLGTNAREALATNATNSHTLYVSLMGDLPAQQVENLLCPGAKVIRMMPQSYLEKAGLPKGILPPRSWATVRGSHVSDKDLEKVMQIAGIDKCVEVNENMTSWSFPHEESHGLIHRFVSSMSDHAVAASKAVHEAEEERDAGDVADFKDAYEVGSVLGSGKFSTVYKAMHRDTGETVAVKSIKDDTMTQDGIDVLIAEVGALNRLKHPNIISHHGFYNEDGKYLLVLEYCNHGSVREMIDERKTMCGTPQYLSPELVSGRLHGTPADIWSTGIMAYMMLSGLVPFDEARNDTELFKLISLGAVWYDQPQWDSVSPAAKNFVQSMLDISPESRPTASELLMHEWLQAP